MYVYVWLVIVSIITIIISIVVTNGLLYDIVCCVVRDVFICQFVFD